jgi:hypothetical protein
VNGSLRTPMGPIIHPTLNQIPVAMLVRHTGSSLGSHHQSVPEIGTTRGFASGRRLRGWICPSRQVLMYTSQPN